MGKYKLSCHRIVQHAIQRTAFLEAKNPNLLHGDKRLVEECTIGNVRILPDSIEIGIIDTA